MGFGFFLGWDMPPLTDTVSGGDSIAGDTKGSGESLNLNLKFQMMINRRKEERLVSKRGLRAPL